MIKRKIFGENKGRGVAGASKLSFGLDMRRRHADPRNIVELLERGGIKRKRKLTLRREPVKT